MGYLLNKTHRFSGLHFFLLQGGAQMTLAWWLLLVNLARSLYFCCGKIVQMTWIITRSDSFCWVRISSCLWRDNLRRALTPNTLSERPVPLWGTGYVWYLACLCWQTKAFFTHTNVANNWLQNYRVSVQFSRNLFFLNLCKKMKATFTSLKKLL